ncbi:hypothetical protein ACI3L0_005378 [Candidozyma auris]|uniref:LicD/FKTN/FKRP nucleotidyltransferase domain-containing protein n=1 Tax=Candidozyma auris TaxID=498019 RepID=A0A2H0ZVW2_CANAR|nr:hypothetical protein B9J08_002557 [[Candida] auris]
MLFHVSVSLLLAYVVNYIVASYKSQDPPVYKATDMKRYLNHRSPSIEESFIPSSLSQSRSLEKWQEELSLEHDPRLLPALWLNKITASLVEGTAKLRLPFEWYFAVDLQEGLQAFGSKNMDSCEELAGFLGISLFDSCETLQNPRQKTSKFRIVKPTDEPLSELSRRYLGANYLLHTLDLPKQVVFLGAGPSDESLVVPIHQQQSQAIHEQPELSLLANGLDRRVSLKEQADHLRSKWRSSRVVYTMETLQAEAVADPTAQDFTVPILKSLFEYEENTLDYQLAKNFHTASSKKYFHEAILEGSGKGSHYDWRFFKQSTFSSYERTAVLHRLTRAWLRFARDACFKSWLAHGTLLGWHWNGLNMPWDEDLDVQITMSSLHVLAKHYNQSVVVDVTDGVQIGHMYLIDVNPHFLQRDRGKGDNVIDARFIDVSTGLYVDITALAVSNDLEVVQNSPGTKRHNRLHQVFDPSYEEISKSFEHAPRLRDSIEARLQRLERGQWKAGKLYNCKDDHFYLLDELGLIPTEFEGVQAYVPIAYHKILKREYPRGTKARIYEGWRFSDKLQLWLPISECGKAALGCDKEDWILEEEFTRNIRHSPEEPGLITKTPAKIDPWLLKRNQRLLKFMT